VVGSCILHGQQPITPPVPTRLPRLPSPAHRPCTLLPAWQGVLKLLHDRGICVRVATKHLAAEEAPESYKVGGKGGAGRGCGWGGAGRIWGMSGLVAAGWVAVDGG